MSRCGVVILGSTGSIGTNALDVMRALSDRFVVAGLSAYSNMDLLARQIEEFHPPQVCVGSEEKRAELARLIDCSGIEVRCGVDGLTALAELESAEKILVAIMGSIAVRPVMCAIAARKQILLANKESLVMAGELVMAAAKKYDRTIIPIDSEHNALFQCIHGRERSSIKKVYLTGSGGPFKDCSMDALFKVTPEEAVCHPKWNMGKKISVDSATLMNKGLETIEAKRLFDLTPEEIGVYIHPEAVIHAMAEFMDNAVIAHMSHADMRLPIQYALTYPDVMPSCVGPLDLVKEGALTFAAPDTARFPCLALAHRALACGGSLPCVLNAANEVCVQAFLNGDIHFMDIPRIIEALMNEHAVAHDLGLDDIYALDADIRIRTDECIKNKIC